MFTHCVCRSSFLAFDVFLTIGLEINKWTNVNEMWWILQHVFGGQGGGSTDSHWPITVISALKMTEMFEGGWTERKKHRRHQFLAEVWQQNAKCMQKL